MILKDYFGVYSVSGKAYRMYGGSNKFFGEIARILMEYAFAHTNPTNMPQKKVVVIVKAYQGETVDWGILTDEGVRAALGSFQFGKHFLPMLAQYLMVLYPPPMTSLQRVPTSPTAPPKTQRQRALTLNRVEWDDTPEPTTEDVTIQQKPPRVSKASPR